MPRASEVGVNITGDATGLTAALSGAQTSLEGFGRLGESILQGFAMALGEVTFEGIIHGVHSLVEEMIGANAVFERYTAQFNVLLGSMGEANKRLEALEGWARKAPFKIPDIVEANRLLQVFGGTLLAGAKGMAMVGDAAAFAHRPIEEVAQLVGRFYSSLQAGAADGRSLLYMSRMGLITGQYRAEIAKLVKEHASGAKIWDVFTQAMQRSHGQMQVMMKTFEGQVTNFSDAMEILKREIGKPFFDAAKQGLVYLLAWLDSGPGQHVKDQLIQMGQQIGELAKTAGPKFLKEVTDGIVRFMNFVTSEQGQATIKTVLGIVEAFGKLAVLVTIGKMLWGVLSPLWTIIKSVGVALEAAGGGAGMLAGALELLSGPVGWVIAAATTLYVAWINNFGGIRDFVIAQIQKIMQWFKDIAPVVSMVWTEIKKWISLAWQFILAQNATSIAILAAGWDWFKNAVAKYWEFIRGAVTLVLLLMSGDATAAFGKLGPSAKAAAIAVEAEMYRMAGLVVQTVASMAGECIKFIDSIAGPLSTLLGVNAKVDSYTGGMSKGLFQTADALDRVKDGLYKVAAAQDTAKASAHNLKAAMLPGGDPGQGFGGGGGKDKGKGGGKGKKGSDPVKDQTAELKDKIAELTKTIYLNGDATDYAALHYDIYRGSLTKANRTVAEHALALTKQAEDLKKQLGLQETTKSEMESLRLEYAKGHATNAVEEADVERRIGKYKDLNVWQWNKIRAQIAINQADAKAIELAKNVTEAVGKAWEEIRKLTDARYKEAVALGVSAEAWRSLTRAQQDNLLQLGRGASLMSQMSSEIERLTKATAELGGEKGAESGLKPLIASVEKFVKDAPAFNLSSAIFKASLAGMLNSLKAASASYDTAKLKASAAEIKRIGDEIFADIKKKRDELKARSTNSDQDRANALLDGYKDKIAAMVKAGAGLMTIAVYISQIMAAIKGQVQDEKTDFFSKNFEAAQAKIADEWAKMNAQLGRFKGTAKEAAIAAIEFENGVQRMTNAQAKQILEDQTQLDKFKAHVEDMKQLADRLAGYFGTLFDDLINGKLKGFWKNALDGFKKMLQDMASEYLKSQIKTLFEKLLMGSAGASGGGGNSGGTGSLLGALLGIGGGSSGGSGGGDASSGDGAGIVSVQNASSSAVSSSYLKNLVSSMARVINTTQSSTSTTIGAPTAQIAGATSATGAGVNIVMNVQTPDAAGFKQSQNQLMANAFAQAQRAAKRAG